MTNIVKLTPEIFLYIKGIEDYKRIHGSEPNEDKKFEIFCTAKVDYKNASLHDKLVIQHHVDDLNDIALDSLNTRKKRKSSTKLKRYCK